MKRILSVLCAIAVLGTMVCSVAFATNPALTATIDGASTTTVGDTFNINIAYSGVEGLNKTNGNNQTAITCIQFKMTVPAGYVVDAADGTYLDEETWVEGAAQTAGLGCSFVGGVFTYALAPSTKATYIVSGSSDLISVPIRCTAAPSSDVEFTISNALIAVTTLVSGSKTNEVKYEGATLDVTPASISVGGGEPSVNTFTATTTLGNSGEAVHSANIGGVESGSAFRIAFTRPAGATSDDAIFGVTADAVRKYSPKQIGILAGLSGDIQMDVSFLNGRDGSIDSKTVTAVSVILANDAGTEFFFSDAEDASNKE